MRAAAFLLAASIALAGCVSTPSGGPRGGAACDVMRVIRPQAEDVDKISVDLGRQILAHNAYLEKACGARP